MYAWKVWIKCQKFLRNLDNHEDSYSEESVHSANLYNRLVMIYMVMFSYDMIACVWNLTLNLYLSEWWVFGYYVWRLRLFFLLFSFLELLIFIIHVSINKKQYDFVTWNFGNAEFVNATIKKRHNTKLPRRPALQQLHRHASVMRFRSKSHQTGKCHTPNYFFSVSISWAGDNMSSEIYIKTSKDW